MAAPRARSRPRAPRPRPGRPDWRGCSTAARARARGALPRAGARIGANPRTRDPPSLAPACFSAPGPPSLQRAVVDPVDFRALRVDVCKGPQHGFVVLEDPPELGASVAERHAVLDGALNQQAV